MNTPSHRRHHLAIKIALAVAVLLVIILSALFIQEYRHIQRLDYISTHRQSFFRSLHGSGPLTAADASSTESWMTFSYMNRAFLLPTAYLETVLGITDNRYPNLTVIEYAKDVGLPLNDALIKVQAAIANYPKAE